MHIIINFLALVGLVTLAFIIWTITRSNPMAILMRTPKFPPAKEFKPIQAWTKLYSEQDHILFNKENEIEIYRTKDHAEFRRRCHGMLAGLVKIVPCQITILEENVGDEKKTEEESLPKM